jgi:ribosomal protein L16/L10AE
MMQPKRTKFRKQFKGKISGSAHRGNTVAFAKSKRRAAPFHAT